MGYSRFFAPWATFAMARAFSGLKSIKFLEDFRPKFLINTLSSQNFEKSYKNIKIQFILGMIDIKLKSSKQFYTSLADWKPQIPFYLLFWLPHFEEKRWTFCSYCNSEIYMASMLCWLNLYLNCLKKDGYSLNFLSKIAYKLENCNFKLKFPQSCMKSNLKLL